MIRPGETVINDMLGAKNKITGWVEVLAMTRISSNLIKHCRWEENYVEKFFLAGLNRRCNPAQHNEFRSYS